MCDYPANKDFLIVEPMLAWKVTKDYGKCETTGPFSKTQIRFDEWLTAEDESWHKDYSPFIGFRCFLEEAGSLKYTGTHNYLHGQVRKVLVKGRCRLAMMDPMMGRDTLIIAEQIKFLPTKEP